MLGVFGFNKKKDSSVSSDDIDSASLEMIKNIKELQDTTVKEIMVPRIDTLCIKLKSKLRDVVDMFVTGGNSRLPVYNDTVDDIVGIIYVKDLFNIVAKGANLDEISLEGSMLKKAYFVPETKKINVLLKEFQNKKIHLAVVVDEYGGFSGIVTLEDIIEEIVGEIQDEYDDEEEEIIKIKDNIFNCDARSDLEEINEQLGLLLPLENVDTLGGFVYNLFGKIPKKDEVIDFKNINFKILNMDKNIIERILITINKTQEEIESETQD